MQNKDINLYKINSLRLPFLLTHVLGSKNVVILVL